MTTYDPTTAARLIAETRDDDARMTDAPWLSDLCGDQGPGRACGVRTGAKHNGYADVLGSDAYDECSHPCSYADSEGIARTRNNLRAMADQLEAAVSEVERINALAIEFGARALLAEVKIDRMLGGRVEVELHVGQDPDDCDPPPAKIDHDVEAWRQADPDIRDEDR